VLIVAWAARPCLFANHGRAARATEEAVMHKNLSTRRIFLQKGLTLLAVAPTIPTFLDQTVLALANPQDAARVQQPNGKDGKILVVVQLSGGNDGLNMVVPHGDDAYHRARPTLRHEPKSVLK